MVDATIHCSPQPPTNLDPRSVTWGFRPAGHHLHMFLVLNGQFSVAFMFPWKMMHFEASGFKTHRESFGDSRHKLVDIASTHQFLCSVSFLFDVVVIDAARWFWRISLCSISGRSIRRVPAKSSKMVSTSLRRKGKWECVLGASENIVFVSWEVFTVQYNTLPSAPVDLSSKYTNYKIFKIWTFPNIHWIYHRFA